MAKEERYVHVRCRYKDAGSPLEYLIIIEAAEQHTGFVPKEFVDVIDDNLAAIEGLVVDDNEGGVTIKFPGDFVLNSSGIFSFPREWADGNTVAAKLKPLEDTA